MTCEQEGRWPGLSIRPTSASCPFSTFADFLSATSRPQEPIERRITAAKGVPARALHTRHPSPPDPPAERGGFGFLPSAAGQWIGSSAGCKIFLELPRVLRVAITGVDRGAYSHSRPSYACAAEKSARAVSDAPRLPETNQRRTHWSRDAMNVVRVSSSRRAERLQGNAT